MPLPSPEISLVRERQKRRKICSRRGNQTFQAREGFGMSLPSLRGRGLKVEVGGKSPGNNDSG